MDCRLPVACLLFCARGAHLDHLLVLLAKIGQNAGTHKSLPPSHPTHINPWGWQRPRHAAFLCLVLSLFPPPSHVRSVDRKILMQSPAQASLVPR
ncbi:hypothetical protein BHM03_00049069 [Ensete ventricosum]|nr:hypothetical protein BHM03_00049069 [Ensete ventricosum]